jgi:hypothetical protein
LTLILSHSPVQAEHRVQAELEALLDFQNLSRYHNPEPARYRNPEQAWLEVVANLGIVVAGTGRRMLRMTSDFNLWSSRLIWLAE